MEGVIDMLGHSAAHIIRNLVSNHSKKKNLFLFPATYLIYKENSLVMLNCLLSGRSWLRYFGEAERGAYDQ